MLDENIDYYPDDSDDIPNWVGCSPEEEVNDVKSNQMCLQ